MSYGGNICHNCLEQIDLDFITIRDYMYDHPGNINVNDLVENTGVSRKVILHLMKQDRLTIKGAGSVSGLTCQVCRKPIAQGSLCEDCKLSLQKDLVSTLPPPSMPAEVKKPSRDKGNPRMHITKK